jgi:hypothetical protein
LAFALRYKYSKDTLGGNFQDTSTASGNWLSAPGVHNQTQVNYSAAGGNPPNFAGGGTVPGQVGAKSPQGDNELGWQYLDSRFTGVSSGALSGVNDTANGVTWNFNAADGGVAEILKNFEINANIPTVEVSFEKTAVEAGTRRLGAKWSVELEQDLKNMNGIDIDAEIKTQAPAPAAAAPPLTLPASARSNPASSRSKDDLPAPFGPVSSNAPPGATCAETASNSSRPPRRQARLSITSASTTAPA